MAAHTATTSSTTTTRRPTPMTSQQPHQHRNVGLLACIAAFMALAQVTTAADITNNNAAVAPAVTRVKRMYALCPPHFERIGQQCYFVSTAKMNWLDAHFDCKDRNSQLAEPVKLEDRRLRKYMLHNDTANTVKWIGGLFNWQKNQWQWGYSGRDMDYQSFSQMMPGWSAKPCVERHNFVCQHNMPYVSERNRHKVYAKWNASYPNEMANEMEVILDDDRQDRTGDRRRFANHHKNAIILNPSTSSSGQNRPAYISSGAYKPTPRKRKPEPFNSTVLGDSNGRFADGKFSQRVDFGAPHRRGPSHRRRPKTTRTTSTTTTSSPEYSSVANGIDDAAFNSLDAGADQRRREAERLAEEQRDQRLDAERRAKHKHEKQERLRQTRERRRQNELRRQQQHEQLMREHQRSTEHDRQDERPNPVMPANSQRPTLTEEERRREEHRMAETRRMLRINVSGNEDNDRYYTTVTSSSATTAATRTNAPTLSPPPTTTTTTTSPSTDSATTSAATAAPQQRSTEIDAVAEAAQREHAEQRIRTEEERQRVELERRAIESQRQRDEYERQERLGAEQRERERAELQLTRDRQERQRYEHEQRIQAEIREHEQLEREEAEREEKRERDLQLRRERDELRRRSDEERRHAKEAKENEIRRLQEKSARNNNDTVPEDVAAAAATAEQQKTLALEKKRKRDKIKQKLMQMTPEQQMEFLQRRAERNQKRQATVDSHNSNNE